MPGIAEFYSIHESKKPVEKRVHHNNSTCPAGRDVPQDERRSGTAGHRLCDDCRKLGTAVK
jgi:hypothetical protein